MNIKSIFSSIERIVLGIFFLIILIAVLIGYFIGSSMRKTSTTVFVENSGAGLPGWSGRKYLPPPPPHPRPPMPAHPPT